MRKPSLVLLPGLICDRTVFAEQEAALAPDYSVYVIPHFYGHDSLASMAEAVLAAAPARFALLGHSMGGRVALKIMMEAPERVERLALFSTGVVPVSPGEPEQRQALIDVARREGMAGLARAWIPMIVAHRRLADAAFLARLTEMFCRASSAIYEAQVGALLTRPDFRPLLPRIACPTLVACGEEDGWSPPARHEEIAAAIPGAKLAILEGSGHMVTMEAPEAVTALIREWLAGADAA